MSIVVEKLAAAGHLTDEQVERIGKTAREIRKLAQEHPEILEEMRKEAGFGDFLKNFGEKFMIGAGATLGAAGVGIGISKLHDLKHSLSKAKNYKDMLDSNPELQNEGIDAKSVQKHFDTLHRFNPEYAADPVVAGTYVHNAMEYARPSIDTVNNIVQARKNHMDAQGRGGPDMKPIAQFLSTSMEAGLAAQRDQMEQAQAQQPALRDLISKAQFEREHLKTLQQTQGKDFGNLDVGPYSEAIQKVREHKGP